MISTLSSLPILLLPQQYGRHAWVRMLGLTVILSVATTATSLTTPATNSVLAQGRQQRRQQTSDNYSLYRNDDRATVAFRRTAATATIIPAVAGRHCREDRYVTAGFATRLLASNKKNDDEEDDLEKDLEEIFNLDNPLFDGPTEKKGTSKNDNSVQNVEKKLGINVGKMLEPLSERDVAELKAAATEIINDAVAAGLDDIEKLRKRMKQDLERQSKSMAFASELNLQLESEKLLGRIDALTDQFLSETAASRQGTKLAAAADQAMQGKGIELGVWGTLSGGIAVTTEGSSSSSKNPSLLGSVGAAQQKQQQQKQTLTKKGADTIESTITTPDANRIVILADTTQDAQAKVLLDPLIASLQETLQTPSGGDLQVSVYKPTQTIPLGGDNAATAIVFLSSFTDKTGVANALERLLRKTMTASAGVGRPPTHVVAISTVGTARTNVMPYSLQNLLGGGKLDKQRQMEETVISMVKKRTVAPSLDYTLCKLGELKKRSSSTTNDVKETFQLLPGDCLDGTLDLDTAVTILQEAIAFQPAARNATLNCIGCLPQPKDNKKSQELEDLLDDAFVRLDGPEVFRVDLSLSDTTDPDLQYESLVEYLREWAFLLAESGKGLTTPIRAEIPVGRPRFPTPAVIRQQTRAVQMLFLPTATGKNYVSSREERQQQSDGEPSRSNRAQQSSRVVGKEGGIEILVEVTNANVMRIRAKRCNYGDDAVLKELTEETILSQLRKSIRVWEAQHQLEEQ